MKRLLAIIILLAGCGSVDIQPTVVELSPSAAWCWYQDPRAVYVSGHTYAGWMTSTGQMQAGDYNHATGEIEIVTVKEKWGVDDHNNPSFLVLPDSRLMIFYTQHNKLGIYAKISAEPKSISAWGDEIAIIESGRVTYSHPIYLKAEKLIYVFWRGESWKPTFSTSPDGVNWSAPRILLRDNRQNMRHKRPYIKIVSNGVDEIHFAFNDGHVRTEPTSSIYYLRYKAGEFTKADGTLVGTMDEAPFKQRDCDVVYDARIAGARAWPFDIEITPDGRPVIAYGAYPTPSDHRYRYAEWDGEWLDQELVAAGGHHPTTARELWYSGGVSLSDINPHILYLSREIKGVFEIERWQRKGGRWMVQPITEDSTENNVRPVVPKGSHDTVLWMAGEYRLYKDYSTRAVLWTK